MLLRVDVDPDEACWLFQGAANDAGYGYVREYEGGAWHVCKAHRVVYEALVGPIPEGLVLRHKCDTRRCVRPEHLEPGTQGQNMREMVERGRHGSNRPCTDDTYEDPWG